MESELLKRAKIKMKHPNPLFCQWLLEWRNEAAISNPSRAITFQRALESLRKCPIELKSGKECLILENFTANLCVKLDRRLMEHKKTEAQFNIIGSDLIEKQETLEEGSNAYEADKSPVKKRKKQRADATQKTHVGKADAKTGRKYIPNYRSAAYALLVALFEQESSPEYIGYMTKIELQTMAQSYTNSSFKKSQPGTYYTAWNSMSQLIAKDLVKKAGNPARYSLTPAGRDLAKELNNSEKTSGISVQRNNYLEPISLHINTTEKNSKDIEEVTNINVGQRSQDETGQNTDFFVFLPNSFIVCLLIDTAETAGGLRKGFDKIKMELKNTSIQYEVRHLKVGDFAWVCKEKDGNRELMLPYIVERKRLDDLSRSIRDGRFHEQKFRLKQCGITNLIYLVEGSEHVNYGMPATSLLQAVMNTQVVDGFTVKVTSGYRSAVRYLVVLTTLFMNTFMTKTLVMTKKENLPLDFNIRDDSVSLFTFTEFCQDSGKIRNFTVKEMFVKQLVQLHGMSADKAWAVVECYPTPRILLESFVAKGKHLLSDLEYGPLSRKLGPAISSTLYHFYTKQIFRK